MQALTKKPVGTDRTPWREMETWGDRMRRILESNLAAPPFPMLMDSVEWFPPVELVEEDGEYLLTAELPGMDKKDVDISVEDHVLTLKGEKKSGRDIKNGRGHIQERVYGAFERSFTIPQNVKVDKIEADFRDGVVEIHLPKGKRSAGQHIEIRGKTK
jgi:HSP20 family protein